MGSVATRVLALAALSRSRFDAPLGTRLEAGVVTDDPNNWWDEAYTGDSPAWDLGRPQPAIERAAERGEIDGHVLDVGCGTGTHARYLAERGHRVTGIDVSSVAIDRARAKTDDPSITFRVADALELDSPLGTFDTVLDCGTFHAFEAATRRRYADRLRSVLKPGGRAIVLAFGADAPAELPPHRIDADAISAAFDDGWTVRTRRDARFETTNGPISGILATIGRRG